MIGVLSIALNAPRHNQPSPATGDPNLSDRLSRIGESIEKKQIRETTNQIYRDKADEYNDVRSDRNHDTLSWEHVFAPITVSTSRGENSPRPVPRSTQLTNEHGTEPGTSPASSWSRTRPWTTRSAFAMSKERVSSSKVSI
jgi:hypothetical protein